MNSINLILLGICLLGVYVAAQPQNMYGLRLPYDPPPTFVPHYRQSPTRGPRPIRIRRQAIGGSLSSSPNGGADARLQISKGIGTPQHGLTGTAFAAGNTMGGPVTTGGNLGYNNHGHGFDLTKTHTPGAIDTFKQSAHVNLFNNGVHNLDANAFASQNKLANGFEFQKNGAGLEYSHINGHGASFTHNNLPGIGQQLELGGRANLWSSPDRNTRLDAFGSASKWTSGPFTNQRTNFGGGVGLTHMFG